MHRVIYSKYYRRHSRIYTDRMHQMADFSKKSDNRAPSISLLPSAIPMLHRFSDAQTPTQARITFILR